jgi:hypothetical protein
VRNKITVVSSSSSRGSGTTGSGNSRGSNDIGVFVLYHSSVLEQ